jgi:putative tricarboxylic transport membrane protein
MTGLAGATEDREAPNMRASRVRDPRSFYGGLALVALALAALWAGSDLPGHRGFGFGPGTAPRMFAGLLVVLGSAVAVMGLVARGPLLERFAVRGPLLITAAVASFAGTVRPLGLVVASFLTFVIAGMASRETRWSENLIAALALTAFSALLFRHLLQLPFRLWPTIPLF